MRRLSSFCVRVQFSVLYFVLLERVSDKRWLILLTVMCTCDFSLSRLLHLLRLVMVWLQAKASLTHFCYSNWTNNFSPFCFRKIHFRSLLKQYCNSTKCSHANLKKSKNTILKSATVNHNESIMWYSNLSRWWLSCMDTTHDVKTRITFYILCALILGGMES